MLNMHLLHGNIIESREKHTLVIDFQTSKFK